MKPRINVLKAGAIVASLAIGAFVCYDLGQTSQDHLIFAQQQRMNELQTEANMLRAQRDSANADRNKLVAYAGGQHAFSAQALLRVEKALPQDHIITASVQSGHIEALDVAAPTLADAVAIADRFPTGLLQIHDEGDRGYMVSLISHIPSTSDPLTPVVPSEPVSAIDEHVSQSTSSNSTALQQP